MADPTIFGLTERVRTLADENADLRRAVRWLASELHVECGCENGMFSPGCFFDEEGEWRWPELPSIRAVIESCLSEKEEA